jgi:glycosyltransferase involved in cell wall biosynthesis
MRAIAVFVKNLTSGGAEKQSVLLAKALMWDYEVHYIIFNGKKVHQKYINMLECDRKIHIHKLEGCFFGKFTAFFTLLKQNDIKAIFSYLTAANFYACMTGLCYKTNVYTGLRNAKLPLLKLWIDRCMANHFATCAISNCYSGKEYFVERGFKEWKIIVIPNCIDEIFPYTKKYANDVIRIITVGRFVAQKDYETAIHAISDLRKINANIRFMLVGYGDLENQIRKWVDKYGINAITDICINPNNISDLLNQADIYLSTSLFEGTSNSIMEAMNANLPIVATDVGDNKYLVAENRNGFLHKAGDFSNISKSLTMLVDNEELRVSMGKYSKQLLSDKYSTKPFKEKYIQLLKSE